MSSSWTEVQVGYKIKWFKISIAGGTCHLTATSSEDDLAAGEDPELMDATCQTLGAAFDLEYDITKVFQVYVDSKVMKPDTIRDLEGRDVGIGLRSDFSAGVDFTLPLKGLKLMTGVRLRKYTLTTDSLGTKAEMLTGPFLGASYGLSL